MGKKSENERKIVTILFADIVNFTTFSESNDPESVTEALEKFLKLGSDSIVQHGGFIDKYIGDCIMGLFGAPVAKGNDSRNAILCAMDIMEKIRKANQTLELPLSIRIGIHTGLVIAGKIGPKNNRQYTVIGHAVNVAKRIQEQGEKDKIYISENTYNLVKTHIICKNAESKKFRGLTKQIRIFEVTGIKKNLNSKLPFIGRKQCLTKLQKAFNTAETGKLQVVSVIGERGVGKSKLIEEFKNFLSDKEIILRYGNGTSTQKFIPYSGVVNIIKINLNINESYGKRKIAKILDKRLNKYERYYLGILMSLSNRKMDIQSKVLKNGIYVSLKSILERLSRHNTLVLILENADYMDNQSLSILEKLVGEMKNTRALFVITSITRLINSGITVNIKPFTKTQSRKFIRMLSHEELDNRTINSIYRRTKGNPLFIEEILNGHDIGKDESSIPFSIHESIMARVDNLPSHSKTLLQYAAVLGYEGDINILQKIANYKQIKFDNIFSDLILSAFLNKLSRNRYTFLHPLVHEIVYNSILIRTRKALHKKIAKIIETKYKNSLEPFYETLVHHYSNTENTVKSLYYLIKAGDKALSLHNIKTAINHYKKAMNMAKLIDDTYTYNYSVLKIGESYYKNSNFASSLKWYKKVSKQNTDLYNEAMLGIAMNQERKGNYKKTIYIVNNLLQSISDTNPIKAKAFYLLSISYFRLAKYKISLNYAFESRKIGIKHGSSQDIANANAFIGHSYRFLGDFDNSEKYHNKNLKIGKSTNDLMRIAYTYDSLASIYRDQGKYLKAEKYLKMSLTLTRRMGQTLNTGDVYSDLAEIYLLMDNYTKAYEYLLNAKKIFQRMGFLYELVILKRRFALYHLKLGNYIRSAKYAMDGLKLAKESGDKLEEGRIRTLLGKIYFHIGKHTLARQEITAALKIFANADALFYLHQAKTALKTFDKITV